MSFVSACHSVKDNWKVELGNEGRAHQQGVFMKGPAFGYCSHWGAWRNHSSLTHPPSKVPCSDHSRRKACGSLWEQGVFSMRCLPSTRELEESRFFFFFFLEGTKGFGLHLEHWNMSCL